MQKFPTITFHSKQVKASGKAKLQITGDLTIHGVTKEVTLDVDGPTAPIKDPRGTTHIGASASTKINRQDFGIDTMPGGWRGRHLHHDRRRTDSASSK